MHLHWNGSFETYYSFFSHLQMQMEVSEIQNNVNNLIFGSDEERALRKAISAYFPMSKQVLCSRHIRDNVSNYLANKVGVRERDRGRIFDLLFGPSGFAQAETLSLDQRLTTLQEEIADLQSPDAAAYINRILLNITEFVNTPHREQRNDSLWTNNGCESLNNILKLAINWRPQQMPKIIRTW